MFNIISASSSANIHDNQRIVVYLNVIFVLLILILLPSTYCHCEYAGTETAVNMALSRPYTYSPDARYSLTRSTTDSTKLTDGRHASAHFWTSPETCGWQESGLIRIEIDLGKQSNIEAIALTSARGNNAGVEFPDRVDIFTSHDRAIYTYIGDLMHGEDNRPGPYEIRTFRRSELSAIGRFVLLVIRPKGKYAFIDEIQVYGVPTLTKTKTAPRSIIKLAEIDKFLEQIHNLGDAGRSLILLSRSFGDSVKDDIQTRERAFTIANNIEQWGDSVTLSRLNTSRAELYRTYQKWAAAHYNGPIILWRPNPWDAFFPFLPPINVEQLVREGISVDCAIGAVTSDSFAITNITEFPLTLRIVTHIPEGPRVILSEAAPVICRDYRTIYDPLINIQNETLIIPAGDSRQIWLSFRTSLSTKGGNYKGALKISGHNISYEIALNVDIHPVTLVNSESQFPAVNIWSYLNWRPIMNYQKEAVYDLIDHHVNVFVIHPDQLPWPTKTVQSQSAYTNFNKLLEVYDKKNTFIFFLAFNYDYQRKLVSSEPFLSKEWKSAFKNWVKQLSVQLQKLGLTYDQFAFYPFDEPRSESDFRIIKETATLIKEVDSRINTYTTIERLLCKDIKSSLNDIDIIQAVPAILPQLRDCLSENRTTQLWMYKPEGGGKRAHPHIFYRLAAWEAFHAGVNGVGFWAYADTGANGTAWNDFDGARPDYSVIYEQKQGFCTSKRWEAWREGIEDFVLLAKAKANLKSTPEVEEFERRLLWILDHPEDYSYFAETRKFLFSIASRQ